MRGSGVTGQERDRRKLRGLIEDAWNGSAAAELVVVDMIASCGDLEPGQVGARSATGLSTLTTLRRTQDTVWSRRYDGSSFTWLSL